MQKKISAIVVAGLLGTVLTGCGGGSSDTQVKKLPEIAPAGIENLEVSQDSLEGLWLITINVEGQRSGTIFEEVPTISSIELALQGVNIMRISGDSEQGYTYTECSEDGESELQALTVEGDQVTFIDSETKQPYSATITSNAKMTGNSANTVFDDDENLLNIEINTATSNSVAYKVRDDVDSPIGTLQTDDLTVDLYCMDASWVSSSAEITGATQTITTQRNTLQLTGKESSFEAEWFVAPEIEGFDLSDIISSYSTVDFNYSSEYFYDETISLKSPKSSFLQLSEQGTVTIDGDEIDFTLNIDLR